MSYGFYFYKAVKVNGPFTVITENDFYDFIVTESKEKIQLLRFDNIKRFKKHNVRRKLLSKFKDKVLVCPIEEATMDSIYSFTDDEILYYTKQVICLPVIEEYRNISRESFRDKFYYHYDRDYSHHPRYFYSLDKFLNFVRKYMDLSDDVLRENIEYFKSNWVDGETFIYLY